MISKKLLSEIIGREVSSINIVGNTVNYTIANYETEEDGELIYIDLGTNINIYELAHKCKEWAIDLGYGIMTSENQDGVSVKLFSPDSFVKEFPPTDSKEYVFNYCQWILEQNKQKD